MKYRKFLFLAFISFSDLFAVEIHEQELQKILMKNKKVHGKFIQEKTLKDIHITLKSNGTFSINQNSGIEWNTDSPIKNSVTITKSSITTTSNGTTSKIDLSNNKVAEKFLGIFLNVVTGDFEKIKSEFQITSRQENEEIEITLLPKNDKIKTMISLIKLHIKNHIIDEIKISSKNDDVFIKFSDVILE